MALTDSQIIDIRKRYKAALDQGPVNFKAFYRQLVAEGINASDVAVENYVKLRSRQDLPPCGLQHIPVASSFLAGLVASVKPTLPAPTGSKAKAKSQPEELAYVGNSSAETDELLDEIEQPLEKTPHYTIFPYDVRLIRKSNQPAEQLAKIFKVPASLVQQIKAGTRFADMGRAA